MERTILDLKIFNPDWEEIGRQQKEEKERYANALGLSKFDENLDGIWNVWEKKIEQLVEDGLDDSFEYNKLIQQAIDEKYFPIKRLTLVQSKFQNLFQIKGLKVFILIVITDKELYKDKKFKHIFLSYLENTLFTEKIELTMKMVSKLYLLNLSVLQS